TTPATARIAQLTVGQRLRFHLVHARAHCESSKFRLGECAFTGSILAFRTAAPNEEPNRCAQDDLVPSQLICRRLKFGDGMEGGLIGRTRVSIETINTRAQCQS